MFGLEPWHIVLLLAAVLVLFGPKRLPEIGKNLGESIREFRKATTEFGESVKAGATEPVPQTQAQAAAQAAPLAQPQSVGGQAVSSESSTPTPPGPSA